jgi:hypothetical protein
LDAVPTRAEGFYWVVLGQNPPEIANEWWLAGDAKPLQPSSAASHRPRRPSLERIKKMFSRITTASVARAISRCCGRSAFCSC